MLPVELILMAFEEENQAIEVLREVKKLEKEGSIRLVDIAVLVKDEAGKTIVKETRDVDAKQGALLGAIVGGLLGLFGGPAGAIIGASAGAATGGITAKKIDLGFSNKFLDELKGSLEPGSSAILAIIEQEWADRFVEELEGYQGNLFRHALKSEIVKQLLDTGKSG